MSTENIKNKSFKANELSKCPFTGAGTPAKFSAGRGQTVRDFWPNSLNLKILSQHSNLSNPMGKRFSYAKEFKKLNYKALKKDLKNEKLIDLENSDVGPINIKRKINGKKIKSVEVLIKLED